MNKSELDKVLRYDAETGIFYWIESRGRAKAGTAAGSLTDRQYIAIGLNGRYYLAHVLAWLTTTGEMPGSQLDHKDTNRSNNRFDNLRLSTQLENTYNRSMMSNNKSGVKGVHWHNFSQRWRAVIGVNGKKIQVGTFESIDLAKKAIDKAREEHHKEFARH